MLAKIVNDNVGILTPRGTLGFFASKLAPTERRVIIPQPYRAPFSLRRIYCDRRRVAGHSNHSHCRQRSLV
ncbi:MAG TPA: hypothetical protein DCE36_16455 [Pseudomonas sp.]|nr:hypothetical protein [Pseudomonas sp.]